MNEKEGLLEMPEGPRKIDRNPKEGYFEGWLKILFGTINMAMLLIYQTKFIGPDKDLYLLPNIFFQKYIADKKR